MPSLLPLYTTNFLKAYMQLDETAYNIANMNTFCTKWWELEASIKYAILSRERFDALI